MNLAKRAQRAQTILEMAVAVTVLCLIMYGLVGVFRWGMMDMAEQRYDHDTVLVNNDLSTYNQINPNYHHIRPVDAVMRRR